MRAKENDSLLCDFTLSHFSTGAGKLFCPSYFTGKPVFLEMDNSQRLFFNLQMSQEINLKWFRRR
jgi:hypothetical protein